ncbi:MAG: hypothetical protein ACREDR_39215 [Blastocatellia bacterium]
MGSSTSKATIGTFLKAFKAKMLDLGLEFVPRKQNLDGLAWLGITIEEAERIILALTDSEYCQGPENDRQGSPGQIYVFGATVEGETIYIKLKLSDDSAKCLSFHPAAFTMRLPHKKDRKS